MEFINMTIGDWMDKIAREYPDQEAVVYTHDFDYKRTYREFNDEAHTIAKAFLAKGLKTATARISSQRICRSSKR